jgi:predicted SnoaL-like aldol condensation-catalyzing enzyme
MSGNERHHAAITAYFAGVNAERFDDVAALFAPAGELHAPGTPPRVGRAAIAAYFAAALRPYPEHHDDPVRTVFAGDTITVEIHFTGRHTAGAPIEFDAVDVFDFDAAGEIVKLSSWYDSYTVRGELRQIRAAAETGAA